VGILLDTVSVKQGFLLSVIIASMIHIHIYLSRVAYTCSLGTDIFAV
jgi:hypothetical protein